MQADVEQRVVRAQGNTELILSAEDDDEEADEAAEPALGTIYYERKMQAERVDFHSRASLELLATSSNTCLSGSSAKACEVASDSCQAFALSSTCETLGA